MKWGTKEIVDMHSLELIQAYSTCLAQEKTREVASKHDKFTKDRKDLATGKEIKKMEFPPPNPLFLKVKQELINELNKRNIQIGN